MNRERVESVELTSANCFMFSCQEGEDASDEEDRVQDVQSEHEKDAKQAR